MIDELVSSLNKSSKNDRTLAQNLRSLKRVLLKCNGSLPRDQSSIEDELRSVLLDCGFDSAAIDAALSSQNTPIEGTEEVIPAVVVANTGNPIEPILLPEMHESPDVLANRLKEEGNKYFMSKDYKNALIHYERVLSMSDISKDIYVKTASNQIAALIAWNGTTRNMMEDAKLNLKKAILMEPSNPKLFYRLGEAQEWLGDLNQAIQSAHLNHRLCPY
jgi:tetratricopeptide (TPR) repeat protein